MDILTPGIIISNILPGTDAIYALPNRTVNLSLALKATGALDSVELLTSISNDLVDWVDISSLISSGLDEVKNISSSFIRFRLTIFPIGIYHVDVSVLAKIASK